MSESQLPPEVLPGAVLYRFPCNRDDIHDIQEEYLLARIATPPGVMVWGRIGERWIPNANARPVVAHLLACRRGLGEALSHILATDGSAGVFDGSGLYAAHGEAEIALREAGFNGR